MLRYTRCAETACPGNTSVQSQLLASYSSCISVHSFTYSTDALATGGTTTAPAALTSSSAAPIGSSTFIPTSTTTTSVAGTTGTTGSGTTTSPSKAAANKMLNGNDGMGGILALVAGIMAALV